MRLNVYTWQLTHVVLVHSEDGEMVFGLICYLNLKSINLIKVNLNLASVKKNFLSSIT